MYCMWKSHRLSLNNVHTPSSNVFDIIHVNIWDHSPVSSVNGMNYFILFADDHISGSMLCITNDRLLKIFSILMNL